MAKTEDGLTDLELSDDEKMDYPRPIPMAHPDYPCHAMFALCESEFRKMEADPADADLGDYVRFEGIACIKHISPPERDKRGDKCRIEFQIQKLKFISHEDGEDDEDEPD